MKKRNIKYLLHFTKFSNYASIMENGLLRRSELNNRLIPYSHNDDLRLDEHENSVSVSIGFPNYRMFYPTRCKFPEDTWIILALNARVLTDKPCAFYPRNAASGCFNGVDPQTIADAVDFDAMFADIAGIERRDLKIPNDYTTDPQAEVLVFADIEPVNIIGIVTQNKIQEAQIRASHPHFGDKNVTKYPRFFSARRDYQYWK